MSESELIPGPRGRPGRDGRDGREGKMGPRGPEGLPGRDGRDGKDGKDGKEAVYALAVLHGFVGSEQDWLRSQKGADGAPGRDGIDGAAGRDGINGKDGAPGKPGAQGAQGPAGHDGIDGRTILNGKGAPPLGLGDIGDFYIDISAWEIYGPKTRGSWGTAVKLRGTNTYVGGVLGLSEEAVQQLIDAQAEVTAASLAELDPSTTTAAESSTINAAHSVLAYNGGLDRNEILSLASLVLAGSALDIQPASGTLAGAILYVAPEYDAVKGYVHVNSSGVQVIYDLSGIDFNKPYRIQNGSTSTALLDFGSESVVSGYTTAGQQLTLPASASITIYRGSAQIYYLGPLVDPAEGVLRYVTATGTYNAVKGEMNQTFRCDGTLGAFVFTLPSSTNLAEGTWATIRKTGTDTNAITIKRSGSGVTLSTLYRDKDEVTYWIVGGLWTLKTQIIAPYFQLITTVGANTWSKPGGAKRHKLYLQAGGSGGGSGRRGAVNTVRNGGNGGGGGGWMEAEFLDSDLPTSVSVTVGAGGAGGAVQTNNDTNGSPGSAGGATTFGTSSNAYFLTTLAPSGGLGGTATTQTQTAVTTMARTPGIGATASATGGAGVNSTSAWTPGGASGAGITSGNATSDGGTGRSRIGGLSNAGGTAPGGDGAPGAAPPSITAIMGGDAGGGGASSITGAAGKGGAGGGYGGGGGGGGASLNGSNSGAGGDGAQGAALIVSYFD